MTPLTATTAFHEYSAKNDGHNNKRRIATSTSACSWCVLQVELRLRLRLRRVDSSEVADYNSFKESPSSSFTIQTEGEVLGDAGSELHLLAIS